MTQHWSLAQELAQLEDVHTIAALLAHATTDTRPNTRPQQGAGEDLETLYSRFLSRRQNRSPATIAQYKRTIPTFIEYAAAFDTTMPGEITPGLLDGFVDELQAVYDSDATIRTYTKNVRAWLAWLDSRGLCHESQYRVLDTEELGLNPSARDEALPAPTARHLLEELQQKRWASLDHTLLALLWNTGIRLGGAHSLDLEDFQPESNELRLRHRPKTGTRLKNGNERHSTQGNGERNIELHPDVIDTLQTYIQTTRSDQTDEHGRHPLFTTAYGRASRSTLRRKLYAATSCRWHHHPTCDGDCCPDSNVCPDSYYPHAIRRGAIVHHLSGGLSPHLASERFDVSIQTIRRHYDPRTNQRRKEDRADAVRNAWANPASHE